MSKKDIYAFREKRGQIILNISTALNISVSEANMIMEYLEKEDFFRLEAPQINDNVTERLIDKHHILKSELGMQSRKVGNIIINTYLNWEKLIVFITSSFSTAYGFVGAAPLAILAGILGCVFSAVSLMDIDLDENSTAIIMALQKYSCFNTYTTTEEQCMLDANGILEANHYAKMDDNEYADEITKLGKIGCISINNGFIKLNEKIAVKY